MAKQTRDYEDVVAKWMRFTRFNRDLYQLLLVAEEFKDKLIAFWNEHDSSTVRDEMTTNGVFTREEYASNKATIDEAMERQTGPLHDVDGFLWALGQFRSAVECMVVPPSPQAPSVDESEVTPYAVVGGEKGGL